MKNEDRPKLPFALVLVGILLAALGVFATLVATMITGDIYPPTLAIPGFALALGGLALGAYRILFGSGEVM